MFRVVLVISLCVSFAVCDTLFFRPWGATKTKTDPNPLCPDKQGTCPSKSTCCKLSSGKYGCCPLPNAVCCSDHVHCCPQGFTCDVSHSTCNQGTLSIDWFLPISANEVTRPNPPGSGLKQEDTSWKELKYIKCPGVQMWCQDDQTCCQLSTKGYGCCPLKEAVCCSDGTHCCPKGYTCNIKLQTCDKTAGQGSTLWIDLLIGKKQEDNKPGESQEVTVNDVGASQGVTVNVVCPGGQASCPETDTCCKSPSGDWRCCPLPEAVCCSDGEHCCPKGYTCNVAAGLCTPSFTDHNPKLTAVLDKAGLIPLNKAAGPNDDIQCPDKISTCPVGTTCCQMKNGYYGCCQYENAVCCTDYIHCCPSNMQCNLTSGQCENHSHTLLFGHPLSDMKLKLNTAPVNVECPDNKSSCPSETTCCLMSSGTYGCCPFPNAKCCSDHLHCCPSDQSCDVEKGSCKGSTQEQPWQVKFPATPKPELERWNYDLQKYENDQEIQRVEGPSRGSDVVCPDKKTQCLGVSTCCVLSYGDYGCCPLPQAVCCADKKHCCPKGYKCNARSGTCYHEQDENVSIPWLEKTAATPVPDNVLPLTDMLVAKEVSKVICPGSQVTCDTGSTCCKLSSGQYGCCPYVNATCCSDHVHCCPSDYTCDVPHSTCVKKDAMSVPWVSKRPALQRQVKLVTDVECPDKQSSCPDGSTCCKLLSGSYGCCPLKSAVCCSDGIHCCPEGTTCDVQAGACDSSEITSFRSSWYTVKRTLKFMQLQSTGDVKCNDKVSCHHDQTCCKLSSGDYGCCPLPAAVCCADGVHCCPTGSTCDATTGMCMGPSHTRDWTQLYNTSPLDDSAPVKSDILCLDKKTYCGHDMTCCKTTTGVYGCCPLPAAVCCPDKTHCCPHGSKCDVKKKTCTGAKDTLDWELISSNLVTKDITCPDKKVTCPHDQTCCKLATGDYGCCPLPAAVCCSDGQHCCPHGSTCNTAAGTCSSTSNSLTISWAQLITRTRLPPSVDNSLVGAVPCPDKSECPWGTTCCETATAGKYACCTGKDATCCADKTHCCPQGFQCSQTPGKCEQAGTALMWDAQAHVHKAARTPTTYTIPWFEKVAAKPVAADNAAHVVCDDMKHTCPEGSSCCRSGHQYKCCPQLQAVCCADGEHCCPQDYHCDTQIQGCVRNP